MTLEQLLIVLIFILLPLINWALQRSQRTRGSEPRPPRPAPEARRARQESRSRQETHARVAAPQATAERLTIPQTAPPPPDFWRREARRRLIPKTREELRQAIILMTILGPCRAAEPPGERKTL